MNHEQIKEQTRKSVVERIKVLAKHEQQLLAMPVNQRNRVLQAVLMEELERHERAALRREEDTDA